MYWFTADEHYGHGNIIKHCGRPFSSAEEMDAEIIRRHNEVVGDEDLVVHVGDFCWAKQRGQALAYEERLTGEHVFLRGDHDKWMSGAPDEDVFYIKVIDGQFLTACHWALRSWPRSHYGAWNLHGHSHGRLEPWSNQLDVGVDCHDFYPVSFDQVRQLIETQCSESP